MATALPNQQQPVVGESALPNPGDQASSSTTSASASSGSIGPFFAVISVLTVLAILSCYFGRIYGRRAAVAPLERIEIGGGFFGWVRTKCRWCTACHDVEVGGNNKVVLGEDKSDTKVRDGEV
ncbi:hypothetical protein TorRG33x02_115760 [Trema orientale]|uniref:Transmembrane protein n=1 Tax=Trema orientale TaxID=63057 RepID=A0A2P5F4K2_TREOI|nr:hypothetical protein TorRG33x02_115760 [Trema orientale]